MTTLDPEQLRQWARTWGARANEFRQIAAELLDRARAAEAMARGLFDDANELESVILESRKPDGKRDPQITQTACG